MNTTLTVVGSVEDGFSLYSHIDGARTLTFILTPDQSRGLVAQVSRWNDVAEKAPPFGVPLVWRGPSGYRPPFDVHEESGYFDPEKPLTPYRTDSRDAYTDGWPAPTHWRLRS